MSVDVLINKEDRLMSFTLHQVDRRKRAHKTNTEKDMKRRQENTELKKINSMN